MNNEGVHYREVIVNVVEVLVHVWADFEVAEFSS